jgi:hypothetical protein
MAMTLDERDNFRQKMLDEYGPGWEEIVTDYRQQVTPRYGPHEDYAGWDVDPTRFRTDNLLSLLSSREDIDAVLNKPTKQDYIDELKAMDPEGRDLLGGLGSTSIPLNSRSGPRWSPKDMMITSGIDDRMRRDLRLEPGAVIGEEERKDYFANQEILPYHAESFQNRISPLPHQLEGPERDRRTWEDRNWTPAYDPNQELYDPNYYGTSGQMGQMGAPPPSIIPSSVTGRHTSPDAPYSVSGMSAMSGGEMPGLLDSGEGQFSQAFPGSDPSEDLKDQVPSWARQSDGLLNGPLAEPSSGEGGKWESDPRFRNALAKYMMQFGNNFSQTDPFYLD